jgi:hypothetical protein
MEPRKTTDLEVTYFMSYLDYEVRKWQGTGEFLDKDGEEICIESEGRKYGPRSGVFTSYVTVAPRLLKHTMTFPVNVLNYVDHRTSGLEGYAVFNMVFQLLNERVGQFDKYVLSLVCKVGYNAVSYSSYTGGMDGFRTMYSLDGLFTYVPMLEYIKQLGYSFDVEFVSLMLHYLLVGAHSTLNFFEMLTDYWDTKYVATGAIFLIVQKMFEFIPVSKYTTYIMSQLSRMYMHLPRRMVLRIVALMKPNHNRGNGNPFVVIAECEYDKRFSTRYKKPVIDKTHLDFSWSDDD